ncbi:MAG: phytanoyl-CoA dioxygenase family protein [Parachlamydia sp.]|nr:phytanoyl-CoA dioxygenase family protein [Parachlamydia sp.]
MDVQALRNPEFWRRINPFLTITEKGNKNWIKPFAIPDSDAAYEKLCREGYAELIGFLPQDLVDKLHSGIENLKAQGINPCFAFVYDEYWNIYRKLRPLLTRFLGESYYQLPEFWTWYIDKSKGESGWGPHRDRNGPSIFPDGAPKAVTLWIPLTNVSAINGCIHVIPAGKDKHYRDFDASEEDYDTTLGHPIEAPAGSILMWNSRLVHWGGKSHPEAQESRISIAFEFQRSDVPLFTKPPIKDPRILIPFLKRLHMIANQIRQYEHWGLPKDLLDLAIKMIKAEFDSR